MAEPESTEGREQRIRRYTMEEMFWTNSSAAQRVLDAQEEALLLAKSSGDIRRINRIAKEKLRGLRQIANARDYS